MTNTDPPMKFFGCFGRSGYAYAPAFKVMDLEDSIMTVELCGSFCYAADMKIAGNVLFIIRILHSKNWLT